jgi:magnesium chelatase subunit I
LNTSNIKDFVHHSYLSSPKYKELIRGVPKSYKQIKTLGDLLGVNYKHITVDEQLRGNLILKMRRGENPYSGIIGYDDDVVPGVNRAILSGHEMLFIGQIGQAKTKIAESIAKSLLSPIPIVQGTITNDIPTSIDEEHLISLLTDSDFFQRSPEFRVSKDCEEIIRNNKLDTRIEWLDGASRYRYILATPDISVKDLVGQIDAIKIAKKGVEIYNIESYSPGQLLQARHGILCVDELPVLDSRKQVALLSVLQEGKFTTGSYPIIFKPDAKIFATANPIDYTHSGKIIEPLFDRLRSHIYTHYPLKIDDEMLIIIQEARTPDASNAFLPIFILKTIAIIMNLARRHPNISQDKGVSVRMGVHSVELLIGEAERNRSILNSVKAVPRFCDIYCLHQSSKFELNDIDDTPQNRRETLESIIDSAIKEVSLEYVKRISPQQIMKVKNEFSPDKIFLVSQGILGHRSSEIISYESQLSQFSELKQVVNECAAYIKYEQERFVEIAKKFGIITDTISLSSDLNSEFRASVTELILEGFRYYEPPLLDRKDNSYGIAHS